MSGTVDALPYGAMRSDNPQAPILICNEDPAEATADLVVLREAGFPADIVAPAALNEEVRARQARVVVLGMVTGRSSLFLARRLRNDDACRHTGLVVSAPWGSYEPRELMASGANRILWRPCGPDRFLAEVTALSRVPLRQDACFDVYLRREDGDLSRGESINVSESGVLLHCDNALTPGEEVKLYLILPGRVSCLRADVVRRARERGLGHYGLEFGHPRAEVRDSVLAALA